MIAGVTRLPRRLRSRWRRTTPSAKVGPFVVLFLSLVLVVVLTYKSPGPRPQPPVTAAGPSSVAPTPATGASETSSPVPDLTVEARLAPPSITPPLRATLFEPDRGAPAPLRPETAPPPVAALTLRVPPPVQRPQVASLPQPERQPEPQPEPQAETGPEQQPSPAPPAARPQASTPAAPVPPSPPPVRTFDLERSRLASAGEPAKAVLPPAPPPVPPAVLPRPPVQMAALLSLPPPPRPRSSAPPSGSGRLALIIDDLGNDPAAARRVIALPAPLTLSFLPYGNDLDRLTAAGVGAGHEVFLHLPMQPMGTADPGRNAVLVGLPGAELTRRLDWAFAQVPHISGVNNHMGSRATSDPMTMLAVLEAVRRRGLVFVDSRTISTSVAADVAADLGVPETSRDVFVDDDPTPGAIDARLAEAERVARTHGSAVAIGHPYRTTIVELTRWLPDARQRGITFVKASALVRRCRAQTVTVAADCEAGRDCIPRPLC